MLKDKIEEAKELIPLLNEGFISLQKLLSKYPTPYIVLKEIFSYLNRKDIKQINKATEDIVISQNMVIFNISSCKYLDLEFKKKLYIFTNYFFVLTAEHENLN